MVFLKKNGGLNSYSRTGYPYCKEKRTDIQVFWGGVLLKAGDEFWRLSISHQGDPKKYFSQVYTRNDISSIVH